MHPEVFNLLVFAASLLAVGLWALYLNRQGTVAVQDQAERQLELAREQYADLQVRIRMAEAQLRRTEQRLPLRVVVRNTTRAQFRGAYRRTTRSAQSRQPAASAK